MALTATQIYTIVNEVAAQAMGSNTMAVVDNAGLVALGNTVLGSNETKNNFINALTDRIGRTIVSFRAYHSHFPDFERDSIEWGIILQKLKLAMPDAEADDSFNLVDGKSVDQYKINKPKVNQLLFTNEAPWQTHITVHLDALEKAFVDSSAMGAFISGMFGEVQNRIELAMENLSIDCVNNYMAEMIKRKGQRPSRVINLVTEYNTANGLTTTDALKPQDALNTPAFLEYVVRRINTISSTMEYMTQGMFNDTAFAGGDTQNAIYSRHTPKSEQRMMLFIDLVNSLKTNVNSKAFNMKEVAIDIPFMTVPFWQSLKTPDGINIKPASGGTAISQASVMGILFDREAMGTFKNKYTSLTSPINAAGKYYNVFYHMIQMYYNDLTENAVVFLLA